MPRGDGTGPAGLGPMTGRAAGHCAGYDGPGYFNPGAGYRGWYPPYPPAPIGGRPLGYRRGLWGLGRFFRPAFGRGRRWGGRGRW